MEHDELTERLQAEMNWQLSRYFLGWKHNISVTMKDAECEILRLKKRALSEKITVTTAIHYRERDGDDNITRVLSQQFNSCEDGQK
jgi:hypothetical protein